MIACHVLWVCLPTQRTRSTFPRMQVDRTKDDLYIGASEASLTYLDGSLREQQGTACSYHDTHVFLRRARWRTMQLQQANGQVLHVWHHISMHKHCGNGTQLSLSCYPLGPICVAQSVDELEVTADRSIYDSS